MKLMGMNCPLKYEGKMVVKSKIFISPNVKISSKYKFDFCFIGFDISLFVFFF